MKKVTAKPQLGFGEAVKLAMSRLTDIKGRSRRSEFWWSMLAFIIVYFIVNSIFELVLPLMAAQIISTFLMLLAMPLTIRRLQDTGKSMWWVSVSWLASAVMNIYMVSSGALEALTSVNPDPDAAINMFKSPVYIGCAFVSTVAGIATFIFCLLDSQPETNKYGESPKYVIEEI